MAIKISASPNDPNVTTDFQDSGGVGFDAGAGGSFGAESGIAYDEDGNEIGAKRGRAFEDLQKRRTAEKEAAASAKAQADAAAKAEADRVAAEQARITGIRGQVADARSRQQALIDRLHGIASGQVKSPAQMAFESQLQLGRNQTQGAASGLTDVGAGGQRRAGLGAQQQLNMSGDANRAILAKQQTQQANNALLDLYSQQRGADAAAADFESRLSQAQQGIKDDAQTGTDARSLNDLLDLYSDKNAGAADLLGANAFNTGIDQEQTDMLLGAAAGGSGAAGK